MFIYKYIKHSSFKNIMKVIGIIPARNQSTRFEGKPLANILGKPMSVDTLSDLNEV